MRKQIKALLLDICFHQSWGYWISNSNKRHRIILGKDYLSLTKNGNSFLGDDVVNFDENSDLNQIKEDILKYFNAKDIDVVKHNEIIDGVIAANSSADLKILLDKVNAFNWKDGSRCMFLVGLLQGALMQYKKDVSIEELNSIFKNK